MTIKHYKKIILGLCALLIFVGAGCGKNDQTQNTTEQPTQEFKHIATEPQLAYMYCLEQNLQPGIRYDTTINSMVLYCDTLAEPSECSAINFRKGLCSPIPELPGFTLATTTATTGCEGLNAPVCGEDGFTYQNICLANIQNIKVIANEACSGIPVPDRTGGVALNNTENTQTSTTQTENSTQNQPNNNTNNLQQAPVSNQENDQRWIDTLIALEKSDPNQAETIIEECLYQPITVYYRSQICPGCLSTLYNESGNVLCYPNNDFAESCPSFFNQETRASNCKTIWERK